MNTRFSTKTFYILILTFIWLLTGTSQNSLFAQFASQKAAADDAATETLVVQIYQVDDLLRAQRDYRFDGFILPGVANDNGLDSRRSSGPQFDGGGFGGGAGMGGMGGGMGGMGGGGQGGGVFRVAPVAPRMPAAAIPTQAGGMGLGGGGMGMGGMAMGVTGTFELYEIAQAIESTVAVESWDGQGGNGTMSTMGSLIIVSQTESVHRQIVAFLDLIRKTVQTKRAPITLKAIWLTIDENQYQSLAVTKDQAVNVDVLEQLTAEHGRRGQIICFDRQTVHIAAGNLKSSVESVIPVVGQLDSPLKLESDLPTALAGLQRPTSETVSNENQPIRFIQSGQFNQSDLSLIPWLTSNQNSGDRDTGLSLQTGNQGQWIRTISMPQTSIAPTVTPTPSNRTVGYQPITRWVNYGTVLQVTPQLATDRKTITVDLSSISVSPKGNGRDVSDFATGAPQVERLDIICQQFQTSVRLVDATPTLIAGSAIEAGLGEKLQTYLILEAIAGQ